MSLSDFYRKECLKKLKDNVGLALAKLSDPASLVQTNIGDLLAGGAGDSQGGLASYAGEYLASNAQGLILSALKATGKEASVLDGLNLFLNMLAQLVAAYNDMILLFLKKQAVTCVKELEKKITINTELKANITAIVNSIASIDAGDPVYDAYLVQLRAALVQLDIGRMDIRLTRNTLAARDTFLPKVYRRGRNGIRDAVAKIKPPTDSVQVVVPKGFNLVTAVAAVAHSGTIYKDRPNIFFSKNDPFDAPAPGGGVVGTFVQNPNQTDNTFDKVKTGDQLTILTIKDNGFLLKGVYTVSQKLDGHALRLDRNVFNVGLAGATTQVSNIDYNITTVVKGVGAAIGSAIIKDLGIPTSASQIENIMAMPLLIKKTIGTMRSYLAQTVKVNGILGFYYSGLNTLLSGLPSLMKGYVLGLFQPVLNTLNTLISSMALVLNNSETAISIDPLEFHPQPLNVTTHSFKWSVDGNLIVEAMKLIPAATVVVQPRKDGLVVVQQPKVLFWTVTQDAHQFEKVKAGDVVEVVDGINSLPGSYTVVKKIAKNALLLDRPPTGGLATTNLQYSVESDGPLGEFQANQNIVNAYKFSVQSLQALGNIGSGSAALFAKEGEEQFAPFSASLLAFLAQAATSFLSSKNPTPTFKLLTAPADSKELSKGSPRQAVISLGQALIRRCDLVEARDREEQRILNVFINTPIPLEDTLNQLLDSLQSLLKALGLDNAADAFASGDYAKLFGMNGKNATYLGAAVEAIAFLKSCFDDEATKSKLDEAENGLKGQKDLFSLKLSFDFDFAILKNIQDCINLNNLANLFQSKEAICQLIKDAKDDPGKAYDKLEALVTGSDDSGKVTDTRNTGLAAQTA